MIMLILVACCFLLVQSSDGVSPEWLKDFKPMMTSESNPIEKVLVTATGPPPLNITVPPKVRKKSVPKIHVTKVSTIASSSRTPLNATKKLSDCPSKTYTSVTEEDRIAPQVQSASPEEGW